MVIPDESSASARQELPVRPLPQVYPWTEFYWTCGADGVLRIQRCNACGKLAHPSGPRCLVCRSSDLGVAEVSGKATVAGSTVNHHQWLPGFPPPYVIAVVQLDEDPDVRITTNIDGCPVGDVVVGMRVEVTFEHQDGVWFPLFTPIPDEQLGDAAVPPGATLDLPVHQRESHRFRAIEKFEDRSVISGIGMSQVGRRLMRNPMGLIADAALAAVADAGLTIDDIDGVSSYPGMSIGGGFSGGSVSEVIEMLDLRPSWHAGGIETSGQTGSVVNAMLAVAAGLCRHVLCYRCVWESTHDQLVKTGVVRPGGGRVGGDAAHRIPFGAASAANWIGLQASRHFHRFGTRREHLGAIALNARRNAALNPSAVYQDPLTMDDYLSARMITTPFGLYDCDVPCDGAVAVIVSAVDTAGDRPHTPIRFEAVGTALTERVSWDQGTLIHEPLLEGAARHLWERTDLRPSDVDVVELYDGFSFNCLSWIEQLGFCEIGEGGPFVEGGTRIALDGELPLNTHGGQLSAGRLHGYGFLHEACVQLRGDGGARQVPGNPEVAVVSAGGGTPGGTFVLTPWR
jgi:acetyl-CoA acetyltransferase/uncharacterized OB-fold protein